MVPQLGKDLPLPKGSLAGLLILGPIITILGFHSYPTREVTFLYSHKVLGLKLALLDVNSYSFKLPPRHSIHLLILNSLTQKFSFFNSSLPIPRAPTKGGLNWFKVPGTGRPTFGARVQTQGSFLDQILGLTLLRFLFNALLH